MEKITEIFNAVTGPHHEAELFVLGNVSPKALILLHGRGGSAEDISSLYAALNTDCYALIPEAVSYSWYPNRFLLPHEENQPALDSALSVITTLLAHLESVGVKKEDTIIAGFSQGACLAAEYVKRNPAIYGAVVIMSGGLIGSDEEVAMIEKSEQLVNTPIYIGCDDHDIHIPIERVLMTAKCFTEAKATVSLEIFNEYGHRPHITALQFIHEHLNK